MVGGGRTLQLGNYEVGIRLYSIKKVKIYILGSEILKCIKT